MYQVIFSKRAVKSFKKIPRDYQVKVKEATLKLAQNPFELDLKKLASYYQATHRLRIGDYRIFLLIDTKSKKIIIANVIRRTSHTYR